MDKYREYAVRLRGEGKSPREHGLGFMSDIKIWVLNRDLAVFDAVGSAWRDGRAIEKYALANQIHDQITDSVRQSEDLLGD